MSPIRKHKRDFRRSSDLSADDVAAVFELTAQFKSALSRGEPTPVLKGKSLAMIFEKPSLRTRSTFDLGMVQLGGHAVYFSPQEIGLGQRESVRDVGKNLERWFDLGVARTNRQSTLDELADNCAIPIVNALSDEEHPCQAMADIFTLQEQLGSAAGCRVTYIGDGNNICRSLIVLGAKVGLRLTVCSPKGYEPEFASSNGIEEDLKRSKGSLRICNDPSGAVKDAQAIYTDVWTSMGQEDEAELRRKVFRDYQVNAALVAKAPQGVLVMHDLPAHRGEEITDEILDGESCIAYDQAENRLHAQKGILAFLDRESG